MQQNYEVIRFVQQNERYHIVIDNVEGQLLSSFVFQNPVLDKKRFWSIISNLAKEIDCLRHSNGEEITLLLTPYHVVVKSEDKIALLRHNDRLETTDDYTYAFGKMIQFMLVKMKLVPRLTWKESRKLKKIISKCMKRGKDIPWIRRSLFFCFFCVGLAMHYKSFEVEETPDQILHAYLDNRIEAHDTKIDKAILAYEESISTSGKLLDYVFLLQIYTKLGTEASKNQILVYGNKVMEELVKNRELIATIYMEQGKQELARKEYEILVSESPSEERYLALVSLAEQCGKNRDAMNLCEQGSSVYPESTELQLQYVRFLLSDIEYSMEDKKEKLDTFLASYPALRNEERFEKLKTEFGYQEEEKDES